MSAWLMVVLLSASALDPLRDFQARVEAYVALHRLLEAGTPPLAVTRDPLEIQLASAALADAIVAARPQARQGDIFTPEVTRILRGRIRTALGPASERLLRELYEGRSARDVRAKVHARDPGGQVPYGVPPALLSALPELPCELRYRIVGRDLALWDEHAALVVDYIPNAFPEQSLTRERSRSWPPPADVRRSGW